MRRPRFRHRCTFMLTYAYFAVLAAACLVALADWRKGVYAAILLDFVRDPVRKLDPSESVLITISVLGLWGVIFVAAWTRSQSELQSYFRRNPYLLKAFRLLVLATIPGCLIAMVSYAGGYRMVALGLVSYLAPTAGVAIGIAYSRRPDEVAKLLSWYCIVNGLALLGVLAEYSGFALPALGGLKDMVWIRYSGTDVVKLIGGFYRSPDIMGLHAAQVAMFSMILTIRKPDRLTPGWALLTAFAGLCLILSGRRKMLGMPLVFVAAFSFLCYLRGMRASRFALVPVACVSLAAVGVYMGATDTYVADEYTSYVGSLFTDGASRSHEILVGSTLSTFDQSGVLGRGIGSATQGNYHIVGNSGDRKLGWQEDGFSRILGELGVFGLFCLLAAVLALLKGVLLAVRAVDRRSPLAAFQLMLFAVVFANLCSFLISHQQYSGDPPSAIIVLFVLGVALSVPSMQQRAMSNHGRNANARGLGPGQGLAPIARSPELFPRETVSKNPLAQLHRRQ
jgi:hypothetical protein